MQPDTQLKSQLKRLKLSGVFNTLDMRLSVTQIALFIKNLIKKVLGQPRTTHGKFNTANSSCQAQFFKSPGEFFKKVSI